jgi:non-heme chloroperoxidase
MNAVRRTLALSALAAALAVPTFAAEAAKPAARTSVAVKKTENYVTTRDGVQIYYKDWGPKNGQVVVFSHGWPLSSDSWEAQMLFLASRATVWSPTTGAATAAPASRGTATTWTTTPTTWPR